MSSRIHAPSRVKWPVPPKGQIYRYLFSSAQNATPINKQVWENLKALAEHYEADIYVSRFRYDTRFHGKTAKPGTGSDDDETWYAPEIADHVLDESVQVAPNLVFCGELQVLPTAKRPISGFETYTGRDSCIIPHAKFALESVASGKREATKLIFTTGVITQRNYVQKKAGQVASFHHCYGALLVEVNSDGHWWCRQLNAANNGSIQDLTVKVHKGKVTTDHRVAAISWGDCHVRRADSMVTKLAWTGPNSMIDVLRPKVQFFHDLLDFRSRNHHEVHSARLRFERFHAEDAAEDDVWAELQEAAHALKERSRPFCKSVVVASNHDAALQRWLDTGDYRNDPKNALTFLRLQTALYESIERRDRTFDLFNYAMQKAGAPKEVKFLREDDSYQVCGIEHGMHGHLGLNGGKSSVLGLSRLGCKAVTGHSHSAAIVDGVYVSGTSSELDLGYNRGPSSWSHSHCVTYPSGKRAIITMWAGRWHA